MMVENLLHSDVSTLDNLDETIHNLGGLDMKLKLVEAILTSYLRKRKFIVSTDTEEK